MLNKVINEEGKETLVLHFWRLNVSEMFFSVTVSLPSSQQRDGEVQFSGPGTVTFIKV